MALRRIALRDFVIVQALELDFSNGFTALTGETGAGKSILIEALQLTLGARAAAAVPGAAARRCASCAKAPSAQTSVQSSIAQQGCIPGWKSQDSSRKMDSCCGAPSTRRAKAARGSTVPQLPQRSCAHWENICWTFMDSMHGKAWCAQTPSAPCWMPMPVHRPLQYRHAGLHGVQRKPM